MTLESTRIIKTLSANDVGETGSHQAGILVPKSPEILSYFPKLDHHLKNPRNTLTFFEPNAITKWDFEFIYYNNKFFDGTRNEYRLTGMTKYLRATNAKRDDALEFYRDADGRRTICLRRAEAQTHDDDGTLRISGGWKIIRLSGR